jgi:HK97 family phage prohead protease
MSTPERRIMLAQEMRASKDSGDKIIEGLAARYGVLSDPISVPNSRVKFRERIQKGAFAKAVNGKQDVVMLINHDPNQLLGRTASKTLTLRDTDAGLRFHCVLPNTSYANDLHESVKRGDVNGCSFAFTLGERDHKCDEMDEDDFDENGEEREGMNASCYDNFYDPKQLPALVAGGRSQARKKPMLVRTISNVTRLLDVSCVTSPAYPRGTSVSARSKSFGDSEINLPKKWNPTPGDWQGLAEYATKMAAKKIEESEQTGRRKNLLTQISNL